MLADEKDALARVDGENPFGDLDPAQRREPDVQQNQIGLELRGLLDGFGAIRGFADDVPFDCGLQHAPNMASPWFVVVDNQHAVSHGHEIFSAHIQATSDNVRNTLRKKVYRECERAIAQILSMSLVVRQCHLAICVELALYRSGFRTTGNESAEEFQTTRKR